MATLLTRLDFKQHYADYHQGLFILLNEKQLPKDQPILNIGKLVSEKLKDISRDQRAEKIHGMLSDFILAYQAVSLVRIDTLFTEYLALDVVKELQGLSRNKKLCVFWPGIVRENKLIYADPDCPEYYECDLHGIMNTFVVKE